MKGSKINNDDLEVIECDKLATDSRKYLHGSLGKGQLAVSLSDLAMLVMLRIHGPMSEQAFTLKAERLFDFDESILIPYVQVWQKNQQKRCNWTSPPHAYIDSLAERFKLMVEEDHAPTVRLPNICPKCRSMLRKHRARNAEVPIWVCLECQTAWAIRISAALEEFTEVEEPSKPQTTNG